MSGGYRSNQHSAEEGGEWQELSSPGSVFRCDGGALLLSAVSHLVHHFFSPFCIRVGPEMHICAEKDRRAAGHVGSSVRR